MAKGFKHGGGGGSSLNFNVVLGTSQPSFPKENDIWVNTSNTSGATWVFSATQPTGQTNLVWIKTGTDSGAAFNALTENGIWVYPIEAKQYVNRAWKKVTAKSYKNGAWSDWWNGELYMSGTWYTEATGNWVSVGKAAGSDSYSGKAPDVQNNADSFKLHYADGNEGSGMYYLGNKIDLTNYTTLRFEGELNPYEGVENRARLQIWSDIGQYTMTNVVAYLAKSGLSSSGTGAIDISALNGAYYIGFNLYSRSFSAETTIICKKLYLT